MKGPPLGPGGEDITGPTRWPPGAEERLVPETSNLKAQTSADMANLLVRTFKYRWGKHLDKSQQERTQGS